jgi:hypothetical protein
MDIGFDTVSGVIREGNQKGLGRILDPRPFFTSSVIGTTKDSNLYKKLPNSPFVNNWSVVFREDFLDSTGRVRRGRFYYASDTRPMNWVVGLSSGAEQPFETFHSLTLSGLPSPKPSELRILLGTQDIFSEWRATGLEYINTSEILVTMRAKLFGHLIPDINLTAIPQRYRSHISELCEKLLNEVHTGLPESIVEICRNLANVILTAKNSEFDPGRPTKDLADEAKYFFDRCSEKKIVSFYSISHCAHIIARLHAEGKFVEQIKSDCLPITDRDAELAISCISRIVTTLGWGSYS